MNEDTISQTYVLSAPYVETPKIQKLNYNPCSCISFARSRRDLPSPVYTPDWFWKHGNGYSNISPAPGLIVITSEGPVGHMAIITKVTSTSLEVIEANYKHCEVDTRTIPLDSPVILGFW